MPTVQVKRAHALGLEEARAKVEEIAESLKNELQADCEWDGNRLLFEWPGATGFIDVGADYIELQIELGMMLALMQGPIEQKANDILDRALS